MEWSPQSGILFSGETTGGFSNTEGHRNHMAAEVKRPDPPKPDTRRARVSARAMESASCAAKEVFLEEEQCSKTM